MVIFLYGPDTFRARRKLKQIVERYQTKNKSGLNLVRFSLMEKSFDELKNFLEAVSMFAEKKLAVIEDLFEASPESKEKFLKYLKEADLGKSQDKFVVIFAQLEKSQDKKTKGKYVFKDKVSQELFAELTKKSVSSEEFDELTGVRLNQWIKREAEVQGGKIEPAAINQLASYVGPDLWLMQNEIQKLIFWAQSRQIGALITSADIDLLVKARLESNIFHLIDALGQQNRKKAIQLLHEQIELGERPEVLLGMFVYQFRNLLAVKDLVEKHVHPSAMNKILKLHPFVLRKTLWQIKNFSLEGLKKVYEKLSAIDMAAKTGRVDLTAALDLLVAEIA